MRDRLAAFTNGELRFIGGSQDTLYIPNRLHQDFMDVLALYNTDRSPTRRNRKNGIATS
jgi:hypothetical protein